MKHARDIHTSELREIVNHLQRVLWKEDGEWNPDTEWDSDTLAEFGLTLEAHGLRPDGEEE